VISLHPIELFVLALYSLDIEKGLRMNIAIIGLGEVGRCYAAPLYEAGHTLGLCEAHPSAAATALAASMELPIHERAGSWL